MVDLGRRHRFNGIVLNGQDDRLFRHIVVLTCLEADVHQNDGGNLLFFGSRSLTVLSGGLFITLFVFIRLLFHPGIGSREDGGFESFRHLFVESCQRQMRIFIQGAFRNLGFDCCIAQGLLLGKVDNRLFLFDFFLEFFFLLLFFFFLFEFFFQLLFLLEVGAINNLLILVLVKIIILAGIIIDLFSVLLRFLFLLFGKLRQTGRFLFRLLFPPVLLFLGRLVQKEVRQHVGAEEQGGSAVHNLEQRLCRAKLSV